MIFLKDFFGNSNGIHEVSFGGSMVVLWYFYGISIGFLWDFHGISMGFLVDSCVSSMGFLWWFFKISLGFQRGVYGISIRFLWDLYCFFFMIFLWRNTARARKNTLRTFHFFRRILVQPSGAAFWWWPLVQLSGASALVQLSGALINLFHLCSSLVHHSVSPFWHTFHADMSGV